MRQSKPIANCPLRYTCEVFKDGTWQPVETGKQFSWWQVDTSHNRKYDWQHALELKKHVELRALAQQLVEQWNTACPNKWRYTLEDTNYES